MYLAKNNSKLIFLWKIIFLLKFAICIDSYSFPALNNLMLLIFHLIFCLMILSECEKMIFLFLIQMHLIWNSFFMDYENGIWMSRLFYLSIYFFYLILRFISFLNLNSFLRCFYFNSIYYFNLRNHINKTHLLLKFL